MNLYLITGKAGSGKDYLANKLKERLDNVVITRLSKYIKIIAIELGLWDGNEDNKPREFLQNTGDLMRAIDTNFLTKRILDDIKTGKLVIDYSCEDIHMFVEAELTKAPVFISVWN